MLRSQSISNISEQRKSRGGFLNALRPRKQANNESNIASASKLQKKPRPLSSSASSINLNQKYNEGLEMKNSYTSTVARRRTGVNNKENYIDTMRTAATTDSSKSSSTKTLKSRSSAPNLKRHSMLIGNNSVTSVSEEMSSSFAKVLSEKTATTEDNLLKNTLSSETLYSNDDIYDDQLSVKLTNFDEGDMLSGSDSFVTLHRTTNMEGICDFVMEIDPNKEKLPINNRKSLDLENLETEKLLETLNCEKKSFVSNLKLVENALFLSSADKKLSKTKLSCPLLCNVENEIMKALKEDPYNDQDEYVLAV